MEAAVQHSGDAAGASKVQHREEYIERREGTNTEDKGPRANVCFTATQPVGGCWQDARQLRYVSSAVHS